MVSALPPSALLDALDIGLALIGEDDRIQHANPALVELCGQKNLQGLSLTQAFGASLTWKDGAAGLEATRPDGVSWDARLIRSKVNGYWLVTVRAGSSAGHIAQVTRQIVHDINNQLQVISISGGALSSISVPGTASWEDANEICEAVEKTHRMMVHLQRLARSVPAPKEPEPEPSESTVAILLVAKHAALGAASARVLTEHGYQTTATTDPDTALRLFAEGNVDWKLVLISMRLKHTNGLLLARMLRREKPDLPIILFASKENLLDEVTQTQAGISAVIERPFTHADLLQTVEKLLA